MPIVSLMGAVGLANLASPPSAFGLAKLASPPSAFASLARRAQMWTSAPQVGNAGPVDAESEVSTATASGRFRRRWTTGPSDLDHTSRRLILGVSTVTAAALVSNATFNYVITPMTQELDATQSQQSLLRQLPSIGALLVIFLAGVLGNRVGPRRFLTSSAALMGVGYAMVLVAPAMPVASLGLLLGSVGQQGLFVVVIGLLSAGLATPSARATGFATLATVSPLVYLVGPIIAGALIGVVGWRVVIGLWVLAAGAAAASAARLLPADASGPGRTGELWTPALAGFALASVVQCVNNISSNGLTSTATLVWLGLGLLATAVLVVLMRRLRSPSLDISVLRHGGFRLLLVVVLLVPFAGLWYYFTIGLQYVYGYTALQAAIIMVPAELTAITGAWLSGRLMKRRGIRLTGTLALLTMSASLFLTVTQTVTMPLVVALSIVCLYSLGMTAANAPVTNSIMNLAAPGAEGSAAAFRGASGSLGNAIGVVMMSTLVFATFQASLTTSLQQSGSDTSQVPAVAQALRDGVSSEQVSTQFAVPLAEVDDIDDEQKQAMVDAYRAQGMAGGFVLLLATAIFAFSRQREPQLPDPGPAQ